MAHTPLPIHLIPTRGLWPAGSSVVPTRDTSPEFLVTRGFVSGTATDLPEESGASHAPKFRGAEYSSIEIIPGVVDYYAYGDPDATTGIIAQRSGSEGTTIVRPIDPAHLQDQLTLIQEEDRISRFNGLVNAFVHRRGRNPSSGFFLVLKSDLTEGLMQSFFTQVVFRQAAVSTESGYDSQATASNNVVTIKKLFLAQAVAVTPVIMGPEFDDDEMSAASDINNQVYMIELADQRAVGKFSARPWTTHGDAISSSLEPALGYFSTQTYNVRVPADNPTAVGGANNKAAYSASTTQVYYESSMSTAGVGSTTPWTWETMLRDIWKGGDLTIGGGSLGVLLGSYSGDDLASLDLTYADFPTHVPENFRVSDSETPYDFFFDVLDSIFHTLIRKLDGTFLVVSPGKLNEPTDSPRNMMRIARHHLQDCLNHVATKWNRLPKTVIVEYPKNAAIRNSGSDNYLVPLDAYSSEASMCLAMGIQINEADLYSSLGLSNANSYSEHSGTGTYTGAMAVGDRTVAGRTPVLGSTDFIIKERIRARYGFERPLVPAADATGDYDNGWIQSDWKIDPTKFVNHAELVTHAKELADLYRDFIVHTDPLLYRRYNGYWNFEGTHKVTEITWGDLGNGPFTILNNTPRSNDEVVQMVRPAKKHEIPPVNRIAWGLVLGSNATHDRTATMTGPIEPGKKGFGSLVTMNPSSSTGLMPRTGSNKIVTLYNIHHARPLLENEIVPMMWDAECQQWIAVSPGGAIDHATEMTWVKAQENWQYGTPLIPTTQYAWVSVKKCDSAGSVSGSAFDVYLSPQSPSNFVQPYQNFFDPNVVSGQVFLAARVEEGFRGSRGADWNSSTELLTAGSWIAIEGHLDAAIGTVRMGAEDLSNYGSAQGWGVMDGSANSSGNGGSGFDMTNYLVKGTIEDSTIGNTDGTLSPSSTTGSTTPASVTSSSTTVTVFSNDDNTSNTDGTGSDQALTDSTTFGSHAHNHTVPGSSHSHTVDRPATRKLVFYERLDNGVDNT